MWFGLPFSLFGFIIPVVAESSHTRVPESIGSTVYKLAGFTILVSAQKATPTRCKAYTALHNQRGHMLYGVEGKALLIGLGGPRRGKTRMKPHSDAL